MRKVFGFGLGLAALIVFLAGVTGASGDRPASSGGVPAYPLKKIVPSGFDVYQGILDWTPVSGTKAIAFARNRVKGTKTFSLCSYSFSITGAGSAPRTIAAEKGIPRMAACVWVADGASGERAGKPYGLVFVDFEESFINYNSAVVYVAKFDSSGGLIGSWRPILKVTSPKGWGVICNNILAFQRENSVGIVPSFWLMQSGQYRIKAQAHFLEVDIKDGILIGAAKAIPLPNNGQYLEALSFAPAWNGTSWLVPLAVSFYKPYVARMEVLNNKLMVAVISGGSSHATVLKEIAADTVASQNTYEAVLAPYPGSAHDLALFVRHRTPVPEAQRKLDMFRYDFSLKRLDVKGRIVKTTPVSIAAPEHKLAYDPIYVFSSEWDNLSRAVAKNGTILLSRARTLEIMRKGKWTDRQQEQEVDFYAVNILTGAVTHKARTVSVWKGVWWWRPLIAVFPAGPIAVVNCLYHTATPYPFDNYLTLFDD